MYHLSAPARAAFSEIKEISARLERISDPEEIDHLHARLRVAIKRLRSEATEECEGGKTPRS